MKKYNSNIQYVVSIKEDTAYLCLHLTKDHEGNKINTPYPENPIRRIQVIECEDSGRYQTWSLLQEIPNTPLYLMRRSLKVLRKFHWMILGGRFNQLSHVSSPSLSKPGEYFLALGWLLKEIHMTWAHLEKKRTRLRTYMHTVAGDSVAGIKQRRRDLSSDDIRNLATTSGRGRLKEELESSTWRWGQDF
ncbi:hypothetical protein Tco_0400976 [Tanacetum coccineum]